MSGNTDGPQQSPKSNKPFSRGLMSTVILFGSYRWQHISEKLKASVEVHLVGLPLHYSMYTFSQHQQNPSHNLMYTECTNIRNTVLILSCTPFCPQNNILNYSGHGLYKVLKGTESIPLGCWPMLNPMLPQLCQVGWMSFVWWTILDTDRKMLSVINPATLQFLTHSNQCAWHLLPYPVQTT